jgi:hypothetical protein
VSFFFGLQNLLRVHLVAQYHKARAYYDRSGRSTLLSRALPPSLLQRLESLVARDVATLLWRSKKRFSVTLAVRTELKYLHAYLIDPSNPWEVLIGHMVPRTPNFRSAGDASQLGDGAINHTLRFWFDCRWNARIRAGVKYNPRHADYVHINCLEFIVLLLQIVACFSYLEDPYDLTLVGLPADSFPAIPILLALTDNISSKSWIHRVVTASPRGQALIQIFAALLRRSSLGTQCEHLAGELNVDPDFISRPNLSLAPFDWYSQIFQKMPALRFYFYFRPSPKLDSLILSRLFSNKPQRLPELPRKLGQFAPTASITTGFVMI